MGKPIDIPKYRAPECEVISVRVRLDLLEKIEKLAAESNRSRNDTIRILLENSIDDARIV